MGDEAPLEVESLAEHNGRNKDPEVTTLPRDPGGQARKARWRRLGGNTTPVWNFHHKWKVNSVQLAFCEVQGCSKSVAGSNYGGSTGVLIAHMTDRHQELRERHIVGQDGGRAKAAKTGSCINRYMRAPPGFRECALQWIVMTF